MPKVKLTITQSRCRCGYFKEGQEFIVEDLCPPLCHELWHAIYPMVYALQNGGELDHGETRARMFDARCPDEGRVCVHGEVVSEVMMKLIEPTMEYDKQIQAYRQEFLTFGGSMDGCGSLRRFDRTQDWIDQVESLKKAETTPSHWVPCTQYIYVRELDNKVVGVIQIRHYFNEFLEKYAGHIGYSVCPSERRKGYATQMLRAVLPECKALGIDHVLISCVTGNEGSRRTILNNGGVYESTVYEPKGNVYLERYWITLK